MKTVRHRLINSWSKEVPRAAKEPFPRKLYTTAPRLTRMLTAVKAAAGRIFISMS